MPTVTTFKTYIPGFDERLTATCEFVTKHGAKIIEVTGIVAPTEVAAMTALISAIQAGCILVSAVHKLYDPNFGDTVAD